MQAIIESQYRAALRMLRTAITNHPDELWNSRRYPNRSWRIAYHALFYTHIYLSPSEGEFRRWAGALGEAHFMDAPMEDEHNTKEELLAYTAMIEEWLPQAIAAVPLDTVTSGFEWIPFSRMELHIYNIRHLQHHAGQLYDRLRDNGVEGLDWSGWDRETSQRSRIGSLKLEA